MITTIQYFIYWDGRSHWNIAPINNPEYPLYYLAVGIGSSRSIPPSYGWIALNKSLNPPPIISSTSLPVELVSFSAHVDGKSVLMNW